MPFLLAIAAWILAAPVSFAAASDVHDGPTTKMQLVTAENGVAPNARFVSAGLHIELDEGWKAYWRSPGEVGLPPEIDWSGSENLESVEMLWPAPTRFRAFGIENFGYEKAVTLPLNITLSNPGAPAELRAKVFLLVCEDICIPEEAELALSLPLGSGIDANAASLIAASADLIPDDISRSDVALRSAAFTDDGAALVIEAVHPTGWSTPDVFPELGEGVAFGAPDIRLGDADRLLWASLPILSDPVTDPKTQAEMLRLTLTDGSLAVDAQRPALSDTPANPPFALVGSQTSFADLLSIALLAILGGLILNVMPCVLPVLSIKLASAIKAVDHSAARVRGGFLMSALGVLTFMWVLAIATLAARGMGMTVGWGLQFQNPIFLGVLLLIIAVFAANMLGLFEINLPSGLMTRLSGAGSGGGYGGDFATGAFAAILATPCSAPFLGTAIAFAMAGRPVDIVVIFTALGLGLALPYLLVAAKPGLVRMLPKPGRWMTVLKIVLGGLLALTAAWLLWVLLGVAGPRAAVAMAVMTGLLIVLFSPVGRALGKVRAGVAAAVAVLALAVPAVIKPAPILVATGAETEWAGFDRGEIARMVSQGTVVFVDVTADWCLTCKANKALVLDRDPVASVLAQDGVVAMQADWTRPSDLIAGFLQDFGRFGIPFNVVYGPGAPEGLPLPELLSADAVMEALTTASGAQVASR
ncbi:protein-disulfide reductase DsbD family protein [Tropicimonas sp. S265A]|uniref:protein-disulfide reductase DsbD family protein n=1 Tax=Tropicimonas sp. S265A TaxID=3415134 RepID=UPI003C7A583C